MTITATSPRIQYTASGVQTQFTVPFAFEVEADLVVYQTLAGATPDPATDVLALNTDYTVVGEGYAETTRIVTITVAPAVGDIITIIRDMPIDRSTDFEKSGEFSAADVNNQFDDVVALIQQVDMKLEHLGLLYDNNAILNQRFQNRLPKLPDATTGFTPVWSTTTDGTLTATQIEEGADCSTLRSDLANNDNGTDGARIVGYYTTSDGLNNTTVHTALNTLFSKPTSNDFGTGDMLPTWRTTAPSGWLIYDDGWLALTAGSIPADGRPQHFGSVSPNYEDIYTLFWNNVSDTYAPVVGGRGASAAADWASDKPLRMPLMVGRSVGHYGTPLLFDTFTTDFAVAPTILTMASTSNYSNGMKVQFTTTGTLPSPLAVTTDYWITVNSSTELKVSTSSQNYTEETFITLTNDGTATHTINCQYDSKLIGQYMGEDNHVITKPELAYHRHSIDELQNGGVSLSSLNANAVAVQPVSNTGYEGSSTPFSTWSPTTFMNWMIKL